MKSEVQRLDIEDAVIRYGMICYGMFMITIIIITSICTTTANILLASLIPPRLCKQNDRKWPLCLSDHPLTELFGQASGMEFCYVSSDVAESLFHSGFVLKPKMYQTIIEHLNQNGSKSFENPSKSEPKVVKSIAERPGDTLGHLGDAVAR